MGKNTVAQLDIINWIRMRKEDESEVLVRSKSWGNAVR